MKIVIRDKEKLKTKLNKLDPVLAKSRLYRERKFVLNCLNFSLKNMGSKRQLYTHIIGGRGGGDRGELLNNQREYK